MVTRRQLILATLWRRLRPAATLPLSAVIGLNDLTRPSRPEVTSARSRVATVPTAPGGVELILDFGTDQLLFSDLEGIALDDFVGEFVHQKCRMVVSGAWRVFFRPDSSGARDEVVVEYGDSTHGPVRHVIAPYTATVTKHGVVAAIYRIDRHWWGGRWRWQSSPRAVVRTPDTLRSRGWIPDFGPSGLFGLPPVTKSLRWDGPMTHLEGADPVMATTGDHDQIGYLTEHAADYMIRPSDVTLESLRAEGEWIANACIHLRNSDGSPLDVPGSGIQYVSHGGRLLDIPAPKAGTEPSFIYPDPAHMYPCATAGWLLTDDPYLLEELQFLSNYHLLYYAWRKLPGRITGGQTRAFAWGLRDLMIAAATTPASNPNWLLPAGYFKRALDANLAYAMEFVQSPARIHSLFRAWTRSDMVGAWQSAWLNAVAGLAVKIGFSEWKSVFDWGVDMHVQMSNGQSGWNREWPVPYYFFPNRATATFTELLDSSSDRTVCTSWSDAWTYFSEGSDGRNKPIDSAGWDGSTIMQNNSASFFLHMRSALAVAANAGIPQATGCYAWMHGELGSNLLPNRKLHGQARFSIDGPGESLPAPIVTAAATGFLATLPKGRVRRLGAYGSDSRERARTDYSGIVYDPNGRQMLFFGGGHGPAIDTDIRAFDLVRLRWSSLYPSTPISQMVPSNRDDKLGRWISTNQPLPRHTYNSSCIVGSRYYALQSWTYYDAMRPAPICWYDLRTNVWSYSSAGVPGWFSTAAVAYDKASKKILVVGTDIENSTWAHFWLYDPFDDSIAKISDYKLVARSTIVMRHVPQRDVYVVVQPKGIVWELAFNRTIPAASTLTPIEATGSPPTPVDYNPNGLAFDGKVLGGNVVNGTFYTYDPSTRAWSTAQLQYEDGSHATWTQAYYCIDFDPGSGCYIILARDGQTYAYRS